MACFRAAALCAAFFLTIGFGSVGQATPANAAFCPQVELPVCAVTPTGEHKRYTNSCFAHRDHARVLHPGDCLTQTGGICFMIELPVCAIDPATHKRRTYPNLCQSEADNATLVHQGACRTKPAPQVQSGEYCEQVISCGTKKGKRKQYPTPCAARADGATDITPRLGPTCAILQ